MGLSKQANVLSKAQIAAINNHIKMQRHGLRNQVVFGLSIKAGRRAKEIACLRWYMLLEADGKIGKCINLTNEASKGSSGRIIPLNKELKELLYVWRCNSMAGYLDNDHSLHVISSERSMSVKPQVIVNMFRKWYRALGLVGCSSHSGRRTFITNAARKISTVGGSLRDVQFLAGHSSLNTTQRYIEGDSEARAKIVDMI